MKMKRVAFLNSLYEGFDWMTETSGPFAPILHVNMPLGRLGLKEWLGRYGDITASIRSGRPLVMIDYEPRSIGDEERALMRRTISDVTKFCGAQLISRKMPAAVRVGIYGTEFTWFAPENCSCISAAHVKIVDCYRRSTQSRDEWYARTTSRLSTMRSRFGDCGVMPLYCPTSFVDSMHEMMPASEQVWTVTVAHRLWSASKKPEWLPGFWAGGLKINGKLVRCTWDPNAPWVKAATELFA